MSAAPFGRRLEVPRLRDPSPAELQERFFDPGLPCVVERAQAAERITDRVTTPLEATRAVVPCVVASERNVARISDDDWPPLARAAGAAALVTATTAALRHDYAN